AADVTAGVRIVIADRQLINTSDCQHRDDLVHRRPLLAADAIDRGQVHEAFEGGIGVDRRRGHRIRRLSEKIKRLAGRADNWQIMDRDRCAAAYNTETITYTLHR